MPWGALRADMSDYGIRNSTLMALMPGETSTLWINETNGIEDPKAMVAVKINKDQVVKQVVPEAKKLGKKYDYVWQQKSPVGYLKTMAILQKYIDQSISFNVSENPENYPNEDPAKHEKVPMKVLLDRLLMFYKYGGKAQYYFNTYDGQGEIEVKDEDDCESCKL
jgi:ribonucleoside-diphosphate reductase alpha chain